MILWDVQDHCSSENLKHGCGMKSVLLNITNVIEWRNREQTAVMEKSIYLFPLFEWTKGMVYRTPMIWFSNLYYFLWSCLLKFYRPLGHHFFYNAFAFLLYATKAGMPLAYSKFWSSNHHTLFYQKEKTKKNSSYTLLFLLHCREIL